MQTLVESTLKEILRGAPVESQRIFNICEQREDVVISEEGNEGSQSTDGTGEDSKSKGKGENNVKTDKTKSSYAGTFEEVSDRVKVEVTNRFRGKVYELTPFGKKFVNTIVDHACGDKITDLCLNGEDRIGDNLYPNIGLTKVVNHSWKSYFNQDSRILENGNIINYNVNFDLFVDEDGEPYETLDAETFANTWKQILRISRTVDNTNVSTKLTKPVLMFNDINVAYNESRTQFYKKAGVATTLDERILAQIVKPTWNIQTEIFCEVDRKEVVAETLLDWLVGNIGNNNTSSGAKSSKGSNKGKNNPRFKKFNTNKSNSQPENDDKANALNPNNKED